MNFLRPFEIVKENQGILLISCVCVSFQMTAEDELNIIYMNPLWSSFMSCPRLSLSVIS